MKTKKIISSLFTIAVASTSILFTITPVHAQTATPSTTRVTQLSDTISKARCERITAKVNERISIYETRKNFYQEKHQLTITKIETVLNRLKDKSYDLTKLQTDQQTLSTKKQEFTNLHSTLIQALNDLKTNACNGGTKTEYEAKLTIVTNALNQQKAKAKEIIAFTKDTIIPDIKDLRSQIQKKN